jgi:hypothetical protein
MVRIEIIELNATRLILTDEYGVETFRVQLRDVGACSREAADCSSKLDGFN